MLLMLSARVGWWRATFFFFFLRQSVHCGETVILMILLRSNFVWVLQPTVHSDKVSMVHPQRVTKLESFLSLSAVIILIATTALVSSVNVWFFLLYFWSYFLYVVTSLKTRSRCQVFRCLYIYIYVFIYR